ncbi:NADPH:quinone reductase [Amycolatopsis marina]|uniref:NADPH:quinone reductase n=1 Tax=Amycolatopsis marina TaxID=490629 RepID=A0A1I1C182_9PSEU|nr:NADP-dependent oxidoreductase [Amycolatopsis marina]SFB54638.1 NADPH:quinone reductase [Amycolatopsis marina]
MKAVRYHEHGDADVLRVEDVDLPSPGPGQVLVRVAGTSFNPVEVDIRAGRMRQVFPVGLPHTPGLDVAGTVAEVGRGVTSCGVGDPVVGFLPMTATGAAAEFVLAPANLLTAAPTALSLADAAALPLVALTAWQALFEHADLRPGQRILINGAGGAVGRLAVQLAKRAGATVVATAGPRSIDAVREHGADELIDHTETGVRDIVTDPVDAVLNLVPTSQSTTADLRSLLGRVNPGGVFVTAVPPEPAPEETGTRVVGMSARGDAHELAELVRRVDAGELRVDVGGRLPLRQLPDVHERSAAGTLRGKVVLLPDF